jgi:hypothetical protein
MFNRLVNYGPWADIMTATEASERLNSIVAKRYTGSNRAAIQRFATEVSLHGTTPVNRIIPKLRSIATNANIEWASALNILGSCKHNC